METVDVLSDAETATSPDYFYQRFGFLDIKNKLPGKFNTRAVAFREPEASQTARLTIPNQKQNAPL